MKQESNQWKTNYYPARFTEEQKGSQTMMELKIFNNPEFGEIRTYIEPDGTVLFCGNDVAKALGYASPKDAIAAHAKGAVKRRTLTKGGDEYGGK